MLKEGVGGGGWEGMTYIEGGRGCGEREREEEAGEVFDDTEREREEKM